MKEMIKAMLVLQDEMNCKVNPNWTEAGYEYYRAAWIESAELCDHIGWKWWKKQEIDLEQAQLEIVDIWHFGLSMLILSNDGKVDGISGYVADLCKVYENNKLIPTVPDGSGGRREVNVIELVELMTGEILTKKEFPISWFYILLKQLDMDLDSLYLMYVGKNVLNFFRQDNGYKEGSYIKVWNGKEDNEVLTEILKASEGKDIPDMRKYVYDSLAIKYKELT